jgi:hypothetical protein
MAIKRKQLHRTWTPNDNDAEMCVGTGMRISLHGYASRFRQ